MNHNLIRPATTMDDVCAIVGWSRSLALTRWFADSNLYIPAKPDESHILRALLGEATLQRLVEEFGGTTIWVSGWKHEYARADQIKREIRRLILAGHGSRHISEVLGIGQRQVQRVRLELEDTGLLPKILGEKLPEKTP